jgi:hypothetical protein
MTVLLTNKRVSMIDLLTNGGVSRAGDVQGHRTQTVIKRSAYRSCIHSALLPHTLSAAISPTQRPKTSIANLHTLTHTPVTTLVQSIYLLLDRLTTPAANVRLAQSDCLLSHISSVTLDCASTPRQSTCGKWLPHEPQQQQC